MDTPALKGGSDPTQRSSEDWSESQTLTVRAELDTESEVHSAPPTMYARVSNGATYAKQKYPRTRLTVYCPALQHRRERKESAPRA